MPASALGGAALERRHRGERHQESGAVIERLGRQRLGLARAERLRLRVVEAVGVLHQEVEAAPVGPRPFVAIGADRDADDAGPQLRRLLGAEAVLGDRAGPVALHENVGLTQQRGELLPRARVAQIEMRGKLAAAVVDHQRFHRRQMRRGDQQHVGAVRSERAPAHRPGNHAGEVQHLDAGQRAVSAGSGSGGASPIFSMLNGGSSATARPCGCASHSSNERVAVTTRPATARRRPRTLISIPSIQRPLHRSAVVVAAEQLERAVAMMRQVGVQPHPAAVATAVEAGDRVAIIVSGFPSIPR